ncbi:hypothetical protein HDE_14321 [Halotydeus destructor]|nr:hypothetical protein HDE_14321 [Halotydeus destructor]
MMLVQLTLCAIAFSTAKANVCLIATGTVRGISGVTCSTELLWRNNIACRVNGVTSTTTGTGATAVTTVTPNLQGAVGVGGLSLLAVANGNDNTEQAAIRANVLAIYNVIISEINIIWNQISGSTGAMQAYLVRWETLLNAVGPSLLGAGWETLPGCGLNGGTGPSITCGTLIANSAQEAAAPVRYTRCS